MKRIFARIPTSIPATAILLLTAGLTATGAVAQWPGAVSGHVVDAATGERIAGAVVELPSLTAAGAIARTDPDGSFSIHGLEPGLHALRATAPGYLGHREEVRVRNGAVARVEIALRPRIFDVAPLQVRVARLERQLVVSRADIEESGARSAADVLGEVPGVVVHGGGPTGPATVSIRGSEAGHVLVLLDGAVLNDPVTGAADLSSLSTASIESITVHPGARGARYGPGAVAGVVLIRSRAPEPALRVESTIGSLGERRGSVGLGGTWNGWTAEATARLARVDGQFDFELPPETGGGASTRGNTDLFEAGALVTLAGGVGDGRLRLRVGADRLDRGLPGKSYAPSPHARQELDRIRASGSWRGGAGPAQLETRVHLLDERVRHHDEAPPAGLAYDDHARIGELGSELLLGGVDAGPLHQWQVGAQLSEQWIRSDALVDDAPTARLRAGAFIAAESGLTVGRFDLDLGGAARLDRGSVQGTGSDTGGTLHPSYTATVSLGSEAMRLHGSARSSFTPPALADQFFRQGVAVEPNPDLRGERVPLEIELGARARMTWPVRADAGVALFRGDVRDMIVWTPDFRFVWRPTNTDVRRMGGEAWLDARLLEGVRARASYALAVVTYDTPGSAGAQLAYRPRHTGRGAIDWRRGPWRASVETSYTGERYPTAARVNRLPPYWRTDIAAGREWRLGDWVAGLALNVDRLLDEKSSMIFGFPEPGRTLRLRLDLERALHN